MSYLAPSEFVTKMVDAGESKIFMSTKDTIIRAYMAGAILALAAFMAVTINSQLGIPIVAAAFFPVGFCMLYLMGFDLLTGVFVLCPLAVIDKRPGCTWGGVMRNWTLVFFGNLAGAVTVAFFAAVICTFGFSTEPDKVGQALGNIGVARTLGYEKYGAAGMATLFIRGMLCNWMVSMGVVGAMISTDHAVLLHGLRAFDREHVPVPERADDARLLLDHGLHPLERDPDRARQPGGRPGLYRPHALCHAYQDLAQAGDVESFRTKSNRLRSYSSPPIGGEEHEWDQANAYSSEMH